MRRFYSSLIEAGLGIALGYSAAGTADFVFSFPEPAQLTLDLAKSNHEVQQALGSPITRNWIWDGQVTESQARYETLLTL